MDDVISLHNLNLVRASIPGDTGCCRVRIAQLRVEVSAVGLGKLRHAEYGPDGVDADVRALAAAFAACAFAVAFAKAYHQAHPGAAQARRPECKPT